MLDKTFDPAAIEQKLYQEWESSGVFRADVNSRKNPFCIMMPPPNITGNLHVGHALTYTLPDILVRYKRRQGFDVLWQPGTDHAGIATQMVVERNLAKEGKSRKDFTRSAFVQKVWEWKEQSGGAIVKQLRRLGATPDWSRERFTMDEGLNRAVTKAFVGLYNEGLIYRAKRLVNWDPAQTTGLSDAEVDMKEVKGNLWHIRYPLKDDPSRYIVVATTRPETLLGDTAVAVNAKDARHKSHIGRHAVLPLTGRTIPVIADDYADPDTGSGAVKITPAHDFNDFEVGQRHGLPLLDIMDERGHLNNSVPEAYRGLERFAARKKIVADLEAQGLLEKVEPYTHMVPHGQRSGVVIEPRLSDQWWCDAPALAKGPIEAVEKGRTVFVPQQWENTYFEWLRNIKPWCISRQLWWGHQIPAWYGPDQKIFVAETAAEAEAQALKYYGKNVQLKQDEDVLDTWFSSALWPFSTIGWPETTPELKRYYPTDVMITGFDIIFFWVVRMMMMGLHFMKEVPFRTVHIHGLVVDEKGQKMSKTKGNGIDPLEVMDKYGADALRMALAAYAAQGRNVRLSESRVEGYRNFATKLWNAARYCQMNGCVPVADFDPTSVQETVNRWIVSAVTKAGAELTNALEGFHFDQAAQAMYQFTWGTFCDWYLEFTKPILQNGTEEAKAETRATTAWVLDQILHLLNPIMPFITEEIYEKVSPAPRPRLLTAPWPASSCRETSWLGKLTAWFKGAKDTAPEAQQEMDWVIGLITAIRGARAEVRAPAATQIPLLIAKANAASRQRLETHRNLITRLARLQGITFDPPAIPADSVQIPYGESTLILPLAGIVDLNQERVRLNKEIAAMEAEIAQINQKLSNPNFTSRAPEEVIAEHQERLAEKQTAAATLKQALGRLG